MKNLIGARKDEWITIESSTVCSRKMNISSPWKEAPYVDAAKKTALGGLSLDGFLSLISAVLTLLMLMSLCLIWGLKGLNVSQWALMMLLDPIHSIEALIYIGYGGDPSSAVRVTRRGRLDRKKHQTERIIYHCFVFGLKESEKSALLNAFVGRPFPEEYVPTTGNRYAVNVVDHPAGIKKTLVLREIPEEGVKELLSKRDALAACDVGPMQPDHKQCGYYVMRFMRDIITGFENAASSTFQLSLFKGVSTYSQAQLNEVREEWAKWARHGAGRAPWLAPRGISRDAGGSGPRSCRIAGVGKTAVDTGLRVAACGAGRAALQAVTGVSAPTRSSHSLTCPVRLSGPFRYALRFSGLGLLILTLFSKLTVLATLIIKRN
ncbi:hypothetical protein C2S53_003318 [Perilla frutescens var. hirtella]|uniref:Mitochondrial Rho GTPase 1/3 EF hand associated type-1 domain-containing protein n=1 Tax=Perilla frutescens var. hirtella TaxID=608512 RepID=A0AAD4JHD0_PERFH|nr:hypothetical protein C2S53_003318 [Perilla frutescens var. hirtella]